MATCTLPIKAARIPKVTIPPDCKEADVDIGGRELKLTNLHKVFWRDSGLTKRDLLQYYADVARYLLPHLVGRAMVLKRYPDGADGDFFFMKRAPEPRPEWLEICTIPHKQAGLVEFAVVNDVPALLWTVNLGCIDLNPWYGSCDDYDRPDYLHFDLDPVEGAGFNKVLETALLVRNELHELGIRSYAKTTGSSGIHVYVPIVRGPLQKQVWTFAKAFSKSIAEKYPALITAEYRVANRPRGHVLVDYNQNAWGRTLASVYSVRPRPKATVSAPVTWEEIERGIRMEDFRLDNMRGRLREMGDLWRPLVQKGKRVNLSKYL